MSTTNEDGTPGSARLLTRPFVVVTATAFIFFIYIGMLVPIVPLFIEGPLRRGEFGIGLTIAVFAGRRSSPDRSWVESPIGMDDAYCSSVDPCSLVSPVSHRARSPSSGNS